MKITDAFIRLKELYNDINNKNVMLRVDFRYKNCDTFLLYQNSLELKNTIVLVWIVNKTWHLQSYYINNDNDDYSFIPYIDNNIYKKIGSIFKNDNFSITPFFNELFKMILNKPNIRTISKKEIQNNHQKNNINYENYIYFHHLRTSNISPKQAEKIKKYLGVEKYKILVKYHQTCVFTNNIFEANNFDNALHNLKEVHIV